MLLDNCVTKMVRVVEGVTVWSKTYAPKRFDQVVFATHALMTLELLGEDVTEGEREILAAILHLKKAYIHHDATLMPTSQAAWSSWNFIGKMRIKRRNVAAGIVLEGERRESEMRREGGGQSQQGFVSLDGVKRELAENGESINRDDEPVCDRRHFGIIANIHSSPRPVHQFEARDLERSAKDPTGTYVRSSPILRRYHQSAAFVEGGYIREEYILVLWGSRWTQTSSRRHGDGPRQC